MKLVLLSLAQKARVDAPVVRQLILCAINCNILQGITQGMAGVRNPILLPTFYSSRSGAVSEFADRKVIAVLNYARNGNVVGDLIANRVLIADEMGKLLQKREKKKGEQILPIFEVLASQEDAFVRWQVEIPGELEFRVWKDKGLWDKWIHYYWSTKNQKSLCYVTGENRFVAEMQPSKIRNDADKAKIISSNDWDGFTFRGRFTDTKEYNQYQTCSIGFDVTQRSHNALRWLIARQGYRQDDLAIVAWAINGSPVPQPTDDAFSLLMEGLSPTEAIADVAQNLALRLRKKIAGYNQSIGVTTGIVVMVLNSATPGRMAITYYRKLSGSDFLKRIEDWHKSCCWLHNYRSIEYVDSKGKKKNKYKPFIGAPAPKDIAEAAYGVNRAGRLSVDESMRKATVNAFFHAS